MAKVVAEARIVRCGQCGRGLAEDYGFVVLVRYRGHQSRFYGPGKAVITCPACGSENPVEVEDAAPPGTSP